MKEARRQNRTATESLAARPPLPYIVALPGYPSPSAPLRTNRGSLKLNRSRAFNTSIAMSCLSLLGHTPQPLWRDVEGSASILDTSAMLSSASESSMPTPLLACAHLYDDATKVMIMCSARANRMKLSSSAPTCKVSQERISFDASIIRIILLPYVTFGDCNLIAIPIEHLKTRFVRNFIL